MQRRNFLKTVSAAAIAGSVPFSSSLSFPADQTSIIKPQRIKPGDTLGLIAPGSFIREDELQDSIKNLEGLGFKVYYTKNILARDGYLGGTDEQRAEDIHEMFSNNEVKGIICARGGYGCGRILPLLDYELIRNNPKAIVGYSDITSLLYGIFAKTGLVGFHGPVGISTFNEFSIRYFVDVLVNPHENLTLYNAREEKEEDGYKVKAIYGGTAKGKLIGGNLSLIVSMIGTPYDIDTNGKIIFIEEVGEEPYRIDRMLTQMIQAGKFNGAAGIALGVFSKCEARGSDSGILNSFTLSEVLFDRLAGLKIPVLYGMSFGHITNKFTLPFGIDAELNTLNQTLTLLEPAVY